MSAACVFHVVSDMVGTTRCAVLSLDTASCYCNRAYVSATLCTHCNDLVYDLAYKTPACLQICGLCRAASSTDSGDHRCQRGLSLAGETWMPYQPSHIKAWWIKRHVEDKLCGTERVSSKSQRHMACLTGVLRAKCVTNMAHAAPRANDRQRKPCGGFSHDGWDAKDDTLRNHPYCSTSFWDSKRWVLGNQAQVSTQQTGSNGLRLRPSTSHQA